MRVACVLLCCLLLSASARSQTDSVALKPEFGLRDGFFLSHDDLRHYRPVAKENIVSTMDREQLDFVGKCLEAEKVTYATGRDTLTVSGSAVWGYFQNNAFYINRGGEFYRVPVFGAISYFVATVRVQVPGVYDPRFGYVIGGGTTTELREFVLNYYDGQVQEYSRELIEKLISSDPDLYREYKALGRHQQKEQLRRYLRKYNELHPLYFLK